VVEAAHVNQENPPMSSTATRRRRAAHAFATLVPARYGAPDPPDDRLFEGGAPDAGEVDFAAHAAPWAPGDIRAVPGDGTATDEESGGQPFHEPRKATA
jgi:hypothetical protein